MSSTANSSNGSNNSFSHAFLPGLILGLIVGAVAGAFLPDLMGGPKIPNQSVVGEHTGTSHQRDGRLHEDDQPDVEQALDDARKELDKQAEEHAAEEEAAEGEETPPTPPPSDG